MRNSPVLGNSTLLRRTAVLAAAALTALTLAGCASDEGSVAQDPVAETTSATPTTSAPVEPSETPTETPTETTSAPAVETPSPDADTLITLDTPVDGATVAGTFDVKGTANSPEANVPWHLLDAGGKKVQNGHFTAEGWMDKLYPYAGTVDVSKLPAGTYTFVVSIDDPSGGEGKAPQKVSRSITLQ
jgi:hypothetical protein